MRLEKNELFFVCLYEVFFILCFRINPLLQALSGGSV